MNDDEDNKRRCCWAAKRPSCFFNTMPFHHHHREGGRGQENVSENGLTNHHRSYFLLSCSIIDTSLFNVRSFYFFDILKHLTRCRCCRSKHHFEFSNFSKRKKKRRTIRISSAVERSEIVLSYARLAHPPQRPRSTPVAHASAPQRRRRTLPFRRMNVLRHQTH